MDGWPKSWARDEPDYAVGDRIVVELLPILQHLLARGLAWKTISRHKDNVYLIGAQVLDHMTREPEDALMPVSDAFDHVLYGCEDGEDGPELRYLDAAAQREFNTTCRLVAKFRVAAARNAREGAAA